MYGERKRYVVDDFVGYEAQKWVVWTSDL